MSRRWPVEVTTKLAGLISLVKISARKEKTDIRYPPMAKSQRMAPVDGLHHLWEPPFQIFLGNLGTCLKKISETSTFGKIHDVT
jgi:hypothetical protein